MSRPLVRVAHPDIEGTALVPETALRHMSEQWQRVDDDVPPQTPAVTPDDGSESDAPGDGDTPGDSAGGDVEEEQ